LETGQELRRLNTPTSVLYVAWSPDGRHALLGGNFKCPDVYLWDLVADREVRRLESHEVNVQRVAFGPDGRRALAAGRYGDLALHLWDVETGQEIRRFVGHAETAQGVAFAADGRRIVSGGEDKTIRIWDVETGQELRAMTGHTTPVWCVALSADGKRALSGAGYVKFSGGRPQYKNGKPIMEDCTVRLWDVETGHELCKFEGHTGQVHAVAFSADGRYAVSGSGDKTVRVWRLPR
jgi:WD40 repeat protein